MRRIWRTHRPYTWDISAAAGITGGTGAWNTTNTNWTTDGGATNTSWVNAGAAPFNNAIFGGTTGTVTLGEAISIRNLTFTHSSDTTYTITGSTLNFTGGTITASNPTNNNGVNAIIRSDITGAPAINLQPMAGDRQFTLNPIASGSMVIGAVTGESGNNSEKINLQGGAGSTGTIASVTGPKVFVTGGSWTLNGASTGRDHSITGGTLTLNANLTSTARAVILSGTGTLNYNVASAVSATGATATSGDNGFRIIGGTLDNTSGAAINTNASTQTMTWEGNWTFSGTNGALSNLNLGSGLVWLKGGSRQITVTNAATTLTLGGNVVGSTASFGLTKAGAGTLNLTGNSTYGGVTTITAGTLSVSTIGNGGFNPTLTTTAASATVTASSTANLVVGQTVSSTNIPVGATIASIVNGTTFTLNSGTGVIAATGQASAIGTPRSLGLATNAATNIVFNGGTLRYTGVNATSDRAFTINTGITATIETANNISFAGATGAATTGALTKTGAGQLTLTGVNTYSGLTTVSAGTLLVNGSLAASSVVTVGASGTLGGTGTVSGPTTILGAHTPGNSPGIQTFANNLTYSGGSATVEWELVGNTITNAANPNAVYDQILVNGSLDFAGATSLSLLFNGLGSSVLWANPFWDADQQWTLYEVAGSTTNFGNLSLAAGSYLDSGSNTLASARPSASFSLVPFGQDVLISYVAVPEPTSIGILGTGVALLGLRVARRRKA